MNEAPAPGPDAEPQTTGDRHGHPNMAGRDAGMLRVMGWFFVGLSALVLIGALWRQDAASRIVNLGATVLLLGVGVGMILGGARLKRRASS